MKKSAISLAVASAMGLSMTAANAVNVISMTIEDVGSNTANGTGNYTSALDGVSGAFQFKNNYINVGTYNGATPWTGDVGDLLGSGSANATGSFSTGFLFSGSPFVPYTFGSGFQADITNGVLTVTSMDFGGNYNGGANFNLPPDGNFPLEVLWVNDIGGGDYTAAFRWGHDITSTEDPSLGFTAFTAQWVVEGTLHTTASQVPVPAAAWLFGSGLLGLVGVARRRKKG